VESPVVGQVKIVGILMLVHGITVVLFGGILVAAGVIIMAMPAPPGGGSERWIMGGIYGGGGLLVAILGVLHSVAGVRVMAMKNRVLALVALFSNTLLLMTCYCTLTAIPMMIYGLIVLFNSDVARAFEMVARGATPEEAVRRFTGSYGDVRDDYDEMSDSRRGWEDDRRRRREQDDDLQLDTDPEDHS
jgi:hypothetical protein